MFLDENSQKPPSPLAVLAKISSTTISSSPLSAFTSESTLKAHLKAREFLRRVSRMGKGGLIGTALGIGITVCAVPAVLGVVGFTSAGIVAGSMAAKIMSASAIASGGGVTAGGAVATLQSIGAVGLAASTKAGVTAAAASVGAAFGASKKEPAKIKEEETKS